MNLVLLALTALPFVISPGASFTLTVNAAIAGDKRAGIRVWMGTALGIAVIAFAFGVSGLGALLTSDPAIVATVGMIGGAVLILIGVLAFVRAIRSWGQPASPPPPAARLLVWSFIAVITNAKALSLYAVVIPALTRSGLNGLSLYLTFAIIHIGMLLIWLIAVSSAIRAVPSLGRSPHPRGILLVVSAGVLLILGVLMVVGAIA
ncbi:LysE family translocator [Salinibacterium sp. PAMC 21357]|uniref:LysE family translocator n=1 Tax=Salinibacterium sp. PAMC 21357 TaxID=1112215 RepID=UPI000287F5A6|nr:LysE family transporter [Salinibacterium sp. PAMC 21357]